MFSTSSDKKARERLKNDMDNIDEMRMRAAAARFIEGHPRLIQRLEERRLRQREEDEERWRRLFPPTPTAEMILERIAILRESGVDPHEMDKITKQMYDDGVRVVEAVPSAEPPPQVEEEGEAAVVTVAPLGHLAAPVDSESSSASSDDEDEDEHEGRGAGKSRARRKSRARGRSRTRGRSRVRKRSRDRKRSRARKKSRKQRRRRKYSRKRK